MDDLDLGTTIKGLSSSLKVFNRYTLVRMLGRGGINRSLEFAAFGVGSKKMPASLHVLLSVVVQAAHKARGHPARILCFGVTANER